MPRDLPPPEPVGGQVVLQHIGPFHAQRGQQQRRAEAGAVLAGRAVKHQRQAIAGSASARRTKHDIAGCWRARRRGRPGSAGRAYPRRRRARLPGRSARCPAGRRRRWARSGWGSACTPSSTTGLFSRSCTPRKVDGRADAQGRRSYHGPRLTGSAAPGRGRPGLCARAARHPSGQPPRSRRLEARSSGMASGRSGMAAA